MNRVKVIWTNQAKLALKAIYEFYKEKSLEGAKNVKADLLQGPQTINFTKQYQVDDINPKYRRMVVRNYKILYKYEKNIIQVMDIVSTKQSPEILRKK